MLAAPGGAKLPTPTSIAVENRQPGTTGWVTQDLASRPIEGYASELSVLPGDTLHLHVSTVPSAAYRIDIYRLGWYGDKGGRLIECIPACDKSEVGNPQPRPVPDPVTGEIRAGWPVTDSIPTGQDWTSGYYFARLVPVSGGQASGVLFIVKADRAVRSQVLVVAAVNTWAAYNGWGGKSLYPESSDGGHAANHVSFDRPWGPGSQQQFFAWSIHTVRFLERQGYDVSYTTDVDIDRDPDELLRHRLVIVSGHSEYWTKTMRDAFEAARDRGVNLAFMGANDAYAQIRYENNRRTIVEYRSAALDPYPDPAQKTTYFRSLVPPRYECSLIGVQHSGGLERGNQPAQDFSIVPTALPDPWFAGTGFQAGSKLPGLVGPEWDRIVSPSDAWTCLFTPGDRTVFFHYEAPNPAMNADVTRYVAASGARVFAAGSLQFVWGLDDYRVAGPGHADPRLLQFMVNAMKDLTAPPGKSTLTGSYIPGG